MLLDKLKKFFSWWGEGLYLGLPVSLRKLFRPEQPRLLLQPLSEQQLAVYWRQDGKQKSCGEYDLERGAFDFQRIAKKCTRSKNYLLELVLDQRQTLHLQHHFPEAAQDNIKQVVSYQLDRLTPFAADAAYYDAQISQRDKSKKEVLADIFVAPKTLVDNLSARLSRAGIPEFDRVSVAGAYVSLSHGRQLMNNQSASQAWSRIPLYFFLAALILSLVVPVLYKQRRVSQIENALSDLKRGAAEQLEVRDKLLAAEDALSFLRERRRTSPVVLDVVERLSAEIPQHTWLERLELEGTQVQIRGESARALTLIDTLEESEYFKRVSFRSPVTRSKNSEKDKFHIQAQVEVR